MKSAVEVLAAALAKHRYLLGGGGMHDICTANGCDWTGFDADDHRFHVAEAALAALGEAGVAVTQLPEPVRCRVYPVVIDGETEFVTVPAYDGSGEDDDIHVSGICGLSIVEAKAFAAALLAAARAAENGADHG